MFMQNQKAFTKFEQIVLAEELRRKEAPVRTGLVAGTFVEARGGWKPVEDLREGEGVATYDGGFAPVLNIAHAQSIVSAGVLHVPGGVLNNCDDLTLVDGQHLLMDCAEAEKLLGEPAVLLPVTALEGYRGISRVLPTERQEIFSLKFADEELIYANTGTLVHCPSERPSDFFTTLSMVQARALLSLMDSDLGFLSRLSEAAPAKSALAA